MSKVQGVLGSGPDQIIVTSFKTSGSCEGDAAQDAHAIAVLSEGFTYEIREQALDLYGLQSDFGLTYTTGLRQIRSESQHSSPSAAVRLSRVH